jgi:hypothetical protein
MMDLGTMPPALRRPDQSGDRSLPRLVVVQSRCVRPTPSPRKINAGLRVCAARTRLHIGQVHVRCVGHDSCYNDHDYQNSPNDAAHAPSSNVRWIRVGGIRGRHSVSHRPEGSAGFRNRPSRDDRVISCVRSFGLFCTKRPLLLFMLELLSWDLLPEVPCSRSGGQLANSKANSRTSG